MLRGQWTSWAQHYCWACRLLFPPEVARCPHCLGPLSPARFSAEVPAGQVVEVSPGG